MELLFDDQIKRRILDYVESKDWWVIPHWTEQAQDIAAEIERTHYEGEANGDFQIMMGPMMGLPFFAVSFAHKRRMSAWKLAAIMIHGTTPWGELTRTQMRDALRTHDILLPIAEGADMEPVREAMVAWESWLRN